MQRQSEHFTLALGALLHDVGKVGQRAYAKNEGLSPGSLNLEEYLCPLHPKGFRTHRHVLYTNEFCEKIGECLPLQINGSDLANLASYHHRPSDSLQKVITSADHLSSAMERESQDSAGTVTDFRRTLLTPVVGQVFQDPAAAGNGFAYPLKRYSNTSIFPITVETGTAQNENYLAIWNGLIEAFRSINLNNELAYINTLLSVLEKYLWSVPSATNVETPDISLYDHLKTTAAIALCLQLSPDTEKPFVLVTGDFGGIQKYIMKLKAGTGGLARAIRGRSYEVSAFSDLAAISILYELQLPLTNLIMNAGGHFYLMLPHTDEVQRCLESNQERIHRWILDRRNGELRFNLAWEAVSGGEIETDFPGAIHRLNGLLYTGSLGGLKPLISGNKWAVDEWVRPAFAGKGEDLCKSCRTNPVAGGTGDGETALCIDCRKDRSTGRELVKTSQMIAAFDGSLKYKLPVSSFQLPRGDPDSNTPFDLMVDFRGELRQRYDYPSYTILKNNYVPTDDDGKVMEFSEIAAKSEGVEYLGYLKADIDDLGFLFSNGLSTGGGKPGDRTSISRLTTMSRSLEYFFSGYLHDLLQKKYPYTYTVFSGGDDLLLIGPWDKMFSLAWDLRKEFARYTCNNDNWGLSVGMTLAKPRIPISHAMSEVNRNLARSKDAEGKDSITAFGTTMTWGEYGRAIDAGEKLTRWVMNKTLNIGKIFRFHQYGLRLREFHNCPRNTSLLTVIPQMIYDLARNWNERTDDERKAKQWAHAFTNPEYTDSKLLPFICQYVINKIK